MDRSGDEVPPSAAPLALVTGASSGIGASLARELARRGHDLLLVARDAQSLRALADEVDTEATVVRADLATTEDLLRVEHLVGDRRPALVVNCAATGRHAPLQDQSPDELDATVAVNVLAPLRLTATGLRAGAGVINISSTASDDEVPLLAPYVASKAFLDSLSMSVTAARPRGDASPTVTVVRPGLTRTAFHRRVGEDVTSSPAGSWMSPEDLAPRILDAHAAGFRRVTLDVPAGRITQARRVVRRVLRTLRRERDRR